MKNFKDYHLEKLADPKEQKRHLKIALDEYGRDGDTQSFLLALKDVSLAQGGLAGLAKKTNLNRQNLYSIFSKKGNPRLSTLNVILKGLGFCFSIKPLV